MADESLTHKQSMLKRLWCRYKKAAKESLEYIHRPDHPKKYKAAAFLLHFANLLSLTFWLCTPWAVISLYIFSRNYNSSWDGLIIAVFFGYSVAISIVISLIMLAGIALTKKKKVFVILLVSFFICSSGGLAAYGIGHLQWSRDFKHCRNELEKVINKLESYKKNKGTYPDTKIEATGKNLILYRGFEPLDIEYKNGLYSFTITYYFGYEYTYDSSKKVWEGWD